MKLKCPQDLDLKGKRVILRTAYDVPLEKRGALYSVADDTRIRESLKTLRYLLQKKCRVIIVTWLGRPGGKEVSEYRLDPVVRCLSRLIKRPVTKIGDLSGAYVHEKLEAMKPGDIAMLENIRFSPREEHHDDSLAQQLSSYADCVVFEAFAQSHRDYPSTTGILKLLPSVCGYAMIREISTLAGLLEHPSYPFVVILGGAKISDKIDVITNLLKVADAVLIGGALSHNFLKARGIKIAASLVEGKTLELKKERKKIFNVAEDIMKHVGNTHVNLGPGLNIPKLLLPLDLVAAQGKDLTAKTCIVDLKGKTTLPWNWMYMDIGPRTQDLFSRVIKRAKVVFWNGPLGYIEEKKFAEGSIAIARAIAQSNARSIVGGGDTEAFLRAYHLRSKFDYVSTGGGAVLEFLAGKKIPVLDYLIKK